MLATEPVFGPIPRRASPLATSMNDTPPDCEAIATVCPSGLIAAADGAASVGVIAAQLRRRSERASNTLTVRASTTATRALASVRPTASTAAPPIRLVDSSRPPGSDQRARNVAAGRKVLWLKPW